MADHYKVVSQAPGVGGNIGDSFKGILVGIVIFIAAFPLLWWGEGRQNMAELVEKAELVGSDTAPSVANESLIKTTGKISTLQLLTDPSFLSSLGSHKALVLNRRVEMYAWQEKKRTKKQGDKKVTTYDYVKAWTSRRPDSTKFYDTKNHRNPQMAFKGEKFQVSQGKIGTLSFDASKTEFSELKFLAIDQNQLNLSVPKPLVASGGIVYVPIDTNTKRNVASSPKIGDLKVSYYIFPSDVEGSVVGAWGSGSIVPYFYDDTGSFLGAYAGSLRAFKAYLQTRHTMFSWIIRVASFLMMWVGLNLILGPLFAVMNFIPIVGGAGRALISIVTGVIAFCLWFLTYVLANLWLVLLIMLAAGIGLMIFIKKKKAAGVAYEG